MISQENESYLKISTDLNNKLKNFTLGENSSLCSFDVVSMYRKCNVKKCENILSIKLQKYFDSIQYVTMASLDIHVILKLVILVNESSFILVLDVNCTNRCLVCLWGHLSLLC